LAVSRLQQLAAQLVQPKRGLSDKKASAKKIALAFSPIRTIRYSRLPFYGGSPTLIVYPPPSGCAVKLGGVVGGLGGGGVVTACAIITNQSSVPSIVFSPRHLLSIECPPASAVIVTSLRSL
jgi:hypothetical protein